MGQRTATLTTYISKKGEKTNKVYYNQWGIGRVQLMSLMGNFLAKIGSPMFDLSGSEKMRDESDYFEDINNYDFTDISNVQDVIKYMDNNNGGVVCVCNDMNGKSYIGFVLGEEEVCGTDEEVASRFVPFEEWAQKVGGSYVNESFKKMFLAFVEHFNIEIME